MAKQHPAQSARPPSTGKPANPKTTPGGGAPARAPLPFNDKVPPKMKNGPRRGK